MNSAALDALDVERWRRVETVLDAALELAPQDVAGFLDRECRDDPALRSEVEALLDADRRADGFMAVPAAELVGTLNEPPDAGPSRSSGGGARNAHALPDAPPPARLGRYTVLGELGRGGMGIVYLGRDASLDRAVAIKALPVAVAADPDRLARFLREARSLASLHHPNIAGIHGVEQADGRRFLVLERIDGQTLSERLRAGPLPMRECIDAGVQVAEALAAAHAQGIVHRDLKPGNIMRTPGGLVKVLDFGLAMHVSNREPALARPFASRAASDLTLTGTRLGTPGYMSPEQILARPQDARTDLFAWGAVMYQCLTGARAFPGTSAYSVIAATLNAPPDWTRLPRETPDAVRGLVMQALEKDPARRLADAREAARVLAIEGGLGRNAPRPVAGTDPLRLPEFASRFVGRRHEIEQVLGVLQRSRIVTLTGTGGCGKTRLAAEVARAAHGTIASKVWFADLSAAADAAGVAAAIAEVVEARESAEARLIAAIDRQLDADATGLLVMDNCDAQLGPSAALAAALLAGCPRLTILATSREWLGTAGEQTLRVAPLALPDPERALDPSSAAGAEAVALFVECANAAGGEFHLTESNVAAVAGLCRDLDGVPLAIELAAALLRRDSLEAIAADVERRLRALPAAGEADTLPAAIQLSYERLAADERRFFRSLSVFTGGWSLESAAAVCTDDGDEFTALDLLTRLADKSLVTIQRAARIEPRYRLLEPVRHFAAVRCEAERELPGLRSRHADRFLAVAERCGPALLSGAEQARLLSLLEADHPNVLAALRACETLAGGGEKALRIAGSVWLFWYVRGHFARGRDALARTLALPGAAAATPARAQALFAAGGLAVFQGDYTEGRRLSREALAAYEALGDSLGVARSLSHLALCDGGEGRYAEAGVCYQDAIRIFRESGDARRLSAALNNLGALKRQQGDFRAALAHHEEALQLIRKTEDRDVELVTLVNLGLASARLGRTVLAGRYVAEALAHATDLSARRAGAPALEVAAEVLADRGRVDDAARLVGAARALRASISLASDEWWKRAQAGLDARLRGALGEAAHEAFLAEGAARAFVQAIEDARAWLAPGNAAAVEPAREVTNIERPDGPREAGHEHA